MLDFVSARRKMVDGQVRIADVTDPRIITAMLELPRERFAPPPLAEIAYADLELPATEGGNPKRRLLKPMVLAKLVQAAGIGADDRVLDVGCATGYSSALLARLAAAVLALEEDEALAKAARENLAALGAANVRVVVGPLTKGWAAGAPYDVILVNGAVEIVPDEFCAQLKDGGRLVGVVGKPPVTRGMRYQAVGGHASGWPLFDAPAAALPGFAVPPQFVF